MAIHFPKRKYLSFAELQSRWQADPNDIRAVVASGDLKASMHFIEETTWVDWTPRYGFPYRDFYYDDDRELVPEPLWDPERDDYWKVIADGWFYLQEPTDTGPFACTFRLISELPQPEKERGGTCYDWRALSRSVSLSDVEKKGVFMFTEIARFESAHGANPSTPAEDERPLQTRERNSLLTIIALLTESAGLSLEANSKTAGVIESAAAARGLSISRRAIDNHLKRAREVVPALGK